MGPDTGRAISGAITWQWSCGAARSGIALWSDADLDTTLKLKPLLWEAGIELVDHFIVAGDDMVSMAESGILKETL